MASTEFVQNGVTKYAPIVHQTMLFTFCDLLNHPCPVLTPHPHLGVIWEDDPRGLHPAVWEQWELRTDQVSRGGAVREVKTGMESKGSA